MDKPVPAELHKVPPLNEITTKSTETIPSSQEDEAEDAIKPLAEVDEFDNIWNQDDTYENFDWDALEVVLSQTVP